MTCVKPADRYTQYLYRASADEASSKVAAEFLTLQINYLSDENAAYSFLTRTALKFRAAPQARAFDTWYLGQVLARSDWQLFAKSLATMVETVGNPAHIPVYYRPAFERLVDEASRGNGTAEILATLKSLLPKLASDQVSRHRMAFSLALAEKQIKNVVKLATSYLGWYPMAQV